jgi:hypothetical protein
MTDLYTVHFHGPRRNNTSPEMKSEQRSIWAPTKVQFLYKHLNERYYVRTYAGGKEKWTYLKTILLSVAGNRMREHLDAADSPGQAHPDRPGGERWSRRRGRGRTQRRRRASFHAAGNDEAVDVIKNRTLHGGTQRLGNSVTIQPAKDAESNGWTTPGSEGGVAQAYAPFLPCRVLRRGSGTCCAWAGLRRKRETF